MAGNAAIQERMEQARKKYSSAQSGSEKGRALEDIVAALLEAVSGFEVQARQRKGSGEISDLVVWNEGTDPIGQGLDRVIAVECKSGKAPVGVDVVADMLANLKLRGLNSGVLVSTSGFTKDALDRARHAVMHDRLKLLLLDADALRAVDSAEDARNLLKRKYAELFLR